MSNDNVIEFDMEVCTCNCRDDCLCEGKALLNEQLGLGNTNEQLAEEARKWDEGELDPKDDDWEDMVFVNVAVPRKLLRDLDKYAVQYDMSRDYLIRWWLKGRIKSEEEDE